MNKRLFKASTYVDTVLQAQVTECGVAALAMLLTHFGKYVPMEELREVTGVSRDGSNARIMIAAAKHYGVDLKPALVEPHELVERGLPLIVHLNFGHFAVVETMDDQWVQINDPSGGRRKMTVEEFDVQFTGVALIGQAMPNSESVGQPLSLWKQVSERLSPFKWTLFFGLMIGLLQSVTIVLGVGFLQRFMDGVFDNQTMILSGIFFVLLVVVGWTSWRWRNRFAWVERRLMWGETQRLMRHLIRLPHTFFAYRFPNKLHGTVYTCRNFSALIQQMSVRVVDTIGGFILLAGMFVYSPPLAGLVLGLCMLQIVLVFWIRQHAELLTKTSSVSSLGASYSADVINRIEVLKTGGMDVEYMAQVSGNHAYGITQQQRRVRYDAYERLVEVNTQALALLCVLIWGAVSWPSGVLTVGEIAALVFFAVWGLDKMHGMGKLIGDVRALRDMLAEVDDIYEVADEDDGLSVAPVGDRPKAVGVVLKDVMFGYSHVRPARLHGIDLEILSGQVVGIRGPSGGGKSTIAGVIAGLHRPWSGSVFVDGQDLLSLATDDLARTVALVDKTIFLFDGTVRENLRLWDESVSDETLWQAVRDAGLEEVLEQRGEGLDCRVMERGLNFSGGQRQRLEIARALARNPALLILDEANDALEVTLEKQIMTNLRRRGCTVVVITHREETLRQCDDVFVVEAGRVVSSPDLQERTDTIGHPASSEDSSHPISVVDHKQTETDLSKSEKDRLLTNVFSFVANEIGAKVSDHPAQITSGMGAIYELARYHHLLVRRLMLVSRNWWQRDCGPLIAFWGAHKQPVALLPLLGGGYEMYDLEANTKKQVTKDIASGLDEKVFVLYRRLPDVSQSADDLLRFSFFKSKWDVVSVVTTGLFAMALALVWPLAGERLFLGDVPVMPMAGLLMLAGMSSGLFLTVSHMIQTRLFARVVHQAMTAFWDRVVRLPVGFVRKDRAETLGQVAQGLSTWLGHIQEAVRDGWFALSAMVYLGVLCTFSFTLAMCVLVALLPVAFVPVYLTLRICKLEPIRFEWAVRTSTFLFDLIRGLRRLRAANSRLITVEKWEVMLQDRLDVEWQIGQLINIRDAVVSLLPLLGVVGFFVGMGFDGERVTAGAKIGAVVAVMGLVIAMRSLTQALIAMIMGNDTKQRVIPVLAEPTEAFVLAQVGSRTSLDRQYNKKLDGTVAVQNVTFRYTEHAKPALSNVSLDIPAGKVTVISGPSGCGKSTLLRVMMGYLFSQQGKVLFDDVPLSDWDLGVLRGQMGAVLQEDALWDGILRNNIAGMAPFTLDEVWEALRLVDLDKDVDKMPRKMNTFAGEATLSTGQKQRLVMARQLIRKPRLLILDEATSALDEETEARVFANLRTLGLTCICVAHRESTLAHADWVYRMRDGRVINHDIRA